MVSASLRLEQGSIHRCRATTVKKSRKGRAISIVAERQGFEPWMSFWPILTFQASAFDHSATAPHFA